MRPLIRRVPMASNSASRATTRAVSHFRSFYPLSRLSLVLVLVALASLPQTAARADIHCVDPTRPWICSISIQSAINLASPGDVISISPRVYHERLTIDKSITLRGTTTSQLPPLTTTIDGDAGGGVQCYGTYLNLNQVTIDHNKGSQGAGIYFFDGSLTIVDSTIADNTASLTGGGISARGAVSLTRTNLTRNHTTDVYGGGVYQNIGTFQAQDSTISDNTAHNEGGGLYLSNLTSGTLDRVTISGNRTDTAVAGGMMIQDSQVSITNATLSGNSVIYSGSVGGAVYLVASPGHTASLFLNAVTVANNSAPASSGGGICAYGYNPQSTATVTAVSSVFASNAGGNCNIEANAFSQSYDYNISDDNTCPLPYHADHPNTDPHLQSLALNPPSYVETHALLASSPAHRNSESCSPTDARGVRRPPLRCDSGSFDLSFWTYIPLVSR
jgi:parallel beta-helix repeat protein